MANGNGSRLVLKWALGILATLISLGVGANVALSWNTDRGLAGLGASFEAFQTEMRSTLLRHEAELNELERKLDTHMLRETGRN